MCLQVKPDTIVKIAKRDIPVYKMLEGAGVSPYQYLKYRSGELKKVPHFEYGWHNSPFIEGEVTSPVYEGLHSFSSKKAAQKAATYNEWYDASFVVQCFIPKGVAYIKGLNSEIASLQLQVGKAIWGTKGSEKKMERFNGKKSKIR